MFKLFRLVFIILFIPILSFGQEMPNEVNKLMKHYPQITKFADNGIYFADGTTLVYDDGKTKSKKELLENPDIQDQFHYAYTKERRTDAGRIRSEAFFKKIYGETKKDVMANLVEVVWCPKLVNKKVLVSKVNNFDKIVTALSKELDQHPEYAKYLTNIAGTFQWRWIAGTTRLSNHSFGMTIDINTAYSHYWQWDCKCKDEDLPLKFRNKIPLELIAIFEKFGFIWGGRWEHYDTMHFEYRPELF
jgi:hypothetical protein